MVRQFPPILVTRSQPGAAETAQRLKALGVEAIIEPMLELHADPAVSLPELTAYDGLIFTSANGVRFFLERNSETALPAWCVGPATARAAREAGFALVHESQGDAMALADFIAGQVAANTRNRPLLHIANAAAKGDLIRRLAVLGVPADFLPLYHAVPASALSPRTNSLIERERPMILLLHSARGAEAFGQLTRNTYLNAMSVVAISRQALVPLADRAFASAHIAETPDETALFDALQGAFATLSA